MTKLLCLFGFHDDKFESVLVYKTEYTETSNNRFVCNRCGRKTEWEGATTFSFKATLTNK